MKKGKKIRKEEKAGQQFKESQNATQSDSYWSQHWRMIYEHECPISYNKLLVVQTPVWLSPSRLHSVTLQTSVTVWAGAHPLGKWVDEGVFQGQEDPKSSGGWLFLIERGSHWLEQNSELAGFRSQWIDSPLSFIHISIEC